MVGKHALLGKGKQIKVKTENIQKFKLPNQKEKIVQKNIEPLKSF